MENTFSDFSVLMTVYKKENPEYLERSLSSIENQTILPTKIVIVKDGMLTKELDDVINKHVKKEIEFYKVVSLEKNHGRGYASRIGIKYISTPWFARMDSDDISLKNRFELQLSAINKYKKIYSRLAVVGGQITEFMDDENNIVGCRKVPLKPKKIKQFAAYRSPINNPTVMINKKALFEVGGYSGLNVLEDYDLWIRFLCSDFIIINVAETLVNMRVSNEMYKRRGGIKYLMTYIKQKLIWKKRGIGTNKTVLLSTVAMLGSALFPISIRKYLYQKLLHKD